MAASSPLSSLSSFSCSRDSTEKRGPAFGQETRRALRPRAMWLMGSRARARRGEKASRGGRRQVCVRMKYECIPGKEIELLILHHRRVRLPMPPTVYTGRPLSDPFAAEVKTAEKDTPFTPQKEEAPPPSVIDGIPPAEVLKRPPFDRRTSTEISGIPRLSKTFVAKVRATARSPPPV